jgi:hypothetical protein
MEPGLPVNLQGLTGELPADHGMAQGESSRTRNDPRVTQVSGSADPGATHAK